MRVVVTGGSGRAGEYIIAELAAHGHEVVNADSVPPRQHAQSGDGAPAVSPTTSPARPSTGSGRTDQGTSTRSGRAVGTAAGGQGALRQAPEARAVGNLSLSKGAQAGAPAGDWQSPALFWQVDVTDYGDVVNALTGADAVIHMAAIAAPNHMPEHQLFRINMLSNWNVLEACEVHGIRRVVMASSINALGAGWGHNKYTPLYFPVDEAHPTRVEDAYSQSKWLGEQMAEAFVRRRGPATGSGRAGRGLQIANMRFHALWDPTSALAHRDHGDKRDLGGRRGMGMWSWTGRHDAARACRLAVEREFEGAEAFFINGSDTVLDVPTEDAVRREYPGVPLRKPLPGFAGALDISKARRILGWEPEESWREGTLRMPEPVPGARSPEYQAPWTR